MSFSVIGLILVIYSVCISSIVNSRSCTLNVAHLPKFAPVFITAQKKLAKPEGQLLKWRLGEKGELLCSGDGNSFVNSNTNKRTIECKKDGLYVDNQKGVTNINCVKDVRGNVFPTDIRCTRINNAVYKYIGFKRNDKTSVNYIEICYNKVIASPVYTYHTIWGKGSLYKETYERPPFNDDSIPFVKNDNAYKSQKETLRKLLGRNALDLYFREGDCFSRGHLTPGRDGTFKTWQFATYFYVNTAPQFKQVNGGNWATVEKLVREKAENLNGEIEVYTGVSGILELPKENNKTTPIYLQKKDSRNVMPVPKWFWKVVKFKNSGIGFASLNNPYVNDNGIEIPPECKNFCMRYGWNDNSFSDLSKGYTICCDVATLKNAFSEIPETVNVRNVLAF